MIIYLDLDHRKLTFYVLGRKRIIKKKMSLIIYYFFCFYSPKDIINWSILRNIIKKVTIEYEITQAIYAESLTL